MNSHRCWPAWLLVLAALAAAGCQSREAAPPAVRPPPRSEPSRPSPPPVAPSEKPAPTAVATAPPAQSPSATTPPPAPPPTTDEPRPAPPVASAPPPVEPARTPSIELVPEYVEVLELMDPAGATRVRAQAEPPARVVVETENVRRLRLRRERLSLARDRSVALKLDGQTFEWTRATPIVEFARSANGSWMVASDR